MSKHGWLIENGKQGDELRYRTMEQAMIVWTADHMKAIRFCRRQDAEMFAEGDEDASVSLSIAGWIPKQRPYRTLMRLEFDRKVPLLEQRLRVADVKQPGRKHQKRKGAKAKEKDKATAKRRHALELKKAAKYNALVAAYWRGQRDTYPRLKRKL